MKRMCYNCKNWTRNCCAVSAMRICKYSLNIIPCGLQNERLFTDIWKQGKNQSPRLPNKQMELTPPPRHGGCPLWNGSECKQKIVRSTT
jgi:hypothetical protein